MITALSLLQHSIPLPIAVGNSTGGDRCSRRGETRSVHDPRKAPLLAKLRLTAPHPKLPGDPARSGQPRAIVRRSRELAIASVGKAVAALAGARMIEAIVPAIESDDRYPGIACREGTDVAASRCRHRDRELREVANVRAIAEPRVADTNAATCGRLPVPGNV
jgi:hypothetical protein